MSPVKVAWVLQHRAKGVVEGVLVITAVPLGVTAAEITERLAVWRDAPRFGAPAGRAAHLAKMVSPSTSKTVTANARRIAWDELEPVDRRITLELPAELHTAIVAAARGRGEPVTAYCRRVLARSVKVKL